MTWIPPTVPPLHIELHAAQMSGENVSMGSTQQMERSYQCVLTQLDCGFLKEKLEQSAKIMA